MYILYSFETDRSYIGSTTDKISEGLRRHLSNHGGFTSRANDWVLVYSEIFDTKAEAATYVAIFPSKKISRPGLFAQVV